MLSPASWSASGSISILGFLRQVDTPSFFASLISTAMVKGAKANISIIIMVITNDHLCKRKAVEGGNDVIGVKVEMWAHLNSLIDPFFFGRCFEVYNFFVHFYSRLFFARYASCDVWHMSKDKRRYTLHIYVPSR